VTRPAWAGHAVVVLVAVLLSSHALAQSQATPTPAEGCRVVVDYRDATVGEFPKGWQARDDAARATYRVVSEGDLLFVRGTAEGTGSQIGREFPWDATKEPILSWRWRPRVFPTGADERDSKRYDSPLAVYAVFGTSPMTQAVKYIWSRVVPAGTTLSTGRTPAIVLRVGQPPDEGWTTESVNVLRDYERVHGGGPGRSRGIAVLTDSDQMKSRAVGDYGEFRVCPDRPR
jgi:Protein of unknown function (DUF3047)